MERKVGEVFTYNMEIKNNQLTIDIPEGMEIDTKDIIFDNNNIWDNDNSEIMKVLYIREYVSYKY